MKLREMLKSGEERLREAGISNAAYEARLMMQEAYGKEAAELLAELDRDVCPGALGAAEPAHITKCPGDCGGRITFDASSSQRVRHVPLQQILGYTFFMGLRMNVNRHVLIPRQDTETLAETVLEHEKKRTSGCWIFAPDPAVLRQPWASWEATGILRLPMFRGTRCMWPCATQPCTAYRWILCRAICLKSWKAAST